MVIPVADLWLFFYLFTVNVRRLDLVRKSSAEVDSEPLCDMARVGGKAAIHVNVHAHARKAREPKSTTSRPTSRRASRVEEAHKSPRIVIDSPPSEESIYPSLTTLGSFDDEDEDEFSCKECCKSGIYETGVQCVEIVFPKLNSR